jgi:protein O-GlcNAcase/histone acetyltransferase
MSMATHPTTEFLAGVIEGFYGPPWSAAERLEVLDWMAAWGLNTYLYAPKDDLKHRALWREPYAAPELETLAALVRACERRGLRFIYALSPGLDIRYGRESDLDCLRARFEQMFSTGARDVALLFDDIPGHLDAAELLRWGSLAAAHGHVVNTLFRWVRERFPQARCLFCPTPYCGRMAERGHGGAGYLATLGRELLPEADVFWTGPEIISREIPLAHLRDLQSLLRRKPLLWDNLHANDYDGRRFFVGPYAGRPPEIRDAVSGVLSNPNCEQPLNFVPLRTLAAFVRCAGPWDARAAYLSALREWLPRFATVHEPLSFEDLTLFGDCYYLPHEEGPTAEALCQAAKHLLTVKPAQWPSADSAAFREPARRLRDFCARLAELRDRTLFHALSRRAWELREELDLLLGYVDLKSKSDAADAPCRSDFHLPGTFRGGLVTRLQRWLAQQPDGTFVAASDHIDPWLSTTS